LLTPEVIFRAALRRVDAEGLETLTMRRLASDLGAAPMSLYSHVPNKDDLLIGVVNLATAEMELPGPDMAPWDALRSITREFRRVALRHPNLVPLIMTRPPTGLESLRTLEAALDALRRAGIEPARIARSYRLSASFGIGFVSLEAGGFFRPPDTDGGERGVDPEAVGDMPRVREAAPYLAEWDSDEEFEAGMDVIVEFLSRDLPTTRPDV
jgi:AcrR family transcriptional regulator